MYISSVLKLPKDEKVYVIGMDGIEQELAEEGVAFEGGNVRQCSIQAYTSLTVDLLGSRR